MDANWKHLRNLNRFSSLEVRLRLPGNTGGVQKARYNMAGGVTEGLEKSGRKKMSAVVES